MKILNNKRAIRALTRVGLEQKCIEQLDLLCEIRLWLGRMPYKVFKACPDSILDQIAKHTD